MKRYKIERAKKKTFEDIREAILESLDKPKTITEISREIESTWLTTRRHLQWLQLMGKVKSVEKYGRMFFYR